MRKKIAKIGPVACMIGGLLLTACQQQTATDSDRFTLTSFVEKQGRALAAARIKVDKKVAIGAKQETRQLSEIDWSKELELFRQADVTKFPLSSHYRRQPIAGGVEYTLLPGEKLAVQSLKLYYGQDTTQITQAEAVLVQENYLYHSLRKLRFQCQSQPDGSLRLSQYSVEGTRKLIFSPTTTFSMQARILPE
jgi:hypothetical protein